jgi:osmotically inducible protein OsmC
VKTVAITLRGKVAGMSAADFAKAAEGAKANCPISRLLKGGAEITLDAQLA